MSETDRPTGYLTLLLRHRNFALLWLSGLLAYFAIWTSNIVVLDVVNDAMHSALAAAVIQIVQFLPAFFLMPLASRILDRHDRRHIILVSKFCNVGLTVVLLFWSSALPVAWVIFIYILYSVSITMFIIAEGALLPLVVARADLMRANILLRISPCLMLVISAALIAEREIGINHEDEFLVVAVLFLASAAVFSRIRGLRCAEGAVPRHGEGLVREFTAGLRYLYRHRELAQVFAIGWPHVGVGGQVLLSVYAEEFFKLGDSGTGQLYLARGLGLLIGTFGLAPLLLSKGVRSTETIRFGLALFGLGYLLASAALGIRHRCCRRIAGPRVSRRGPTQTDNHGASTGTHRCGLSSAGPGGRTGPERCGSKCCRHAHCRMHYRRPRDRAVGFCGHRWTAHRNRLVRQVRKPAVDHVSG